MKKDTRHRKYLLTINNPGEDWSHEKTRAVLDKMQLKYWCLADERGLQEQTPHTHVFFVANSPIRFSTIKGCFPTAHIDPVCGTSEENQAYVQKSGKWAEDEKADTSIPGTFEEWGVLPTESPGQRTDWDIALAMLEDGHSAMDVIRSQTHLMRYRTTLEQVRQELIAEQFRDTFRILETTYIYGATGLGKTKLVMERYGYENVCQITGYQHGCFDKYQSEDVIVFDEFSSGLKIQDMNNLLDGYPLMLPCRYANRVACYTKAYIISNIPLEYQYANVRVETPTIWNAFIRRIHKVVHFTGENQYDEMTTKEYFSPRQKALEGWTEIKDKGDLPFDTDNCKESKPIGGVPNGKSKKSGNSHP
ncbi:hypothetical protein [Faecalispora anaeroviscerum]|uniref:hypothetical protein n=1 Tax=Faecalispora anaeroviscerum TaxID=2991836 RepID=UPI0024BA8205|nr:hypothetical protein [Faecalispora anaeroviscerum]